MTGRGLAGLLEASAAADPGAVAVVDEAGRPLTYADLDSWADGVADALVRAGVAPGDRVGVALPKTPTAIAAIFGALKCGAAYVPVDVAGPAERGRAILEDCDVTAVAVDSRHADFVPGGLRRDAVLVATTPGQSGWASSPRLDELIAVRGNAEHRRRAVPSSSLAYILYTSGSTGTPKGAMISHGNVLAFLDWCSSAFAPTAADRFSSVPPLHFDPSVLDLFLAIKHGASVHLAGADLVRAPAAVARFIAEHRLTIWNSTPSTLMLMLRFANLAEHDTSSLRLVMFGGEVFPVKALRQLRQLWPQAAFYNLYGPTETTVACTAARLPAFIPEDREHPYPIGFPCSHCEAVVLGADGDLVPVGEEGILHIHGPSNFSGYWGRGDESLAAFVDHDGRKWYCTGDVVRFDPIEGHVYLGRRDRMVKRRGHRIELDEIERALDAHPDIREAAVVAGKDSGDGVQLLAYVVFEAGRRRTTVELKAHCAGKLPVYMSPDRFVERQQLPRTSTGKVHYQALLAAEDLRAAS
jgi:amino acid adenylation domain-containing protein